MQPEKMNETVSKNIVDMDW